MVHSFSPFKGKDFFFYALYSKKLSNTIAEYTTCRLKTDWPSSNQSINSLNYNVKPKIILNLGQETALRVRVSGSTSIF